MSARRTLELLLVAVIAVVPLGLAPAPAVAAPSATQTAADQARVERAVKRLEAARARSSRVSEQSERSSAELDRVIAKQQNARERLTSRARAMYRSGDTSFVTVLLGAATFQEFASRWDLLTRMSRQDAADLRGLEAARVKVERSAESLLKLQEEAARAVDAEKREVSRARKELASSRAALAAYTARTAKSTRRSAPRKKKDSTQGLTGTGAWETAVASHYGRNFSGRGASGARIGPYSMIVAHKTLPFGTLIELEYQGKRAVAKVVDRGPFTRGRTFDLGPGVVRVLGFSGVHKVRYRIITR